MPWRRRSVTPSSAESAPTRIWGCVGILAFTLLALAAGGLAVLLFIEGGCVPGVESFSEAQRRSEALRRYQFSAEPDK